MNDLQSPVDSHRVNDVHLIRGNQLILAVIWLTTRWQVFWSVEPSNANIDVFLVERSHFQDLCLPLRRDIDLGVLCVVVFYKNVLSSRDAFGTN